MPKLNTSQAFRLYGIARTTINRHCRSGRLSYELAPSGAKLIDLSELIRVYGEPPRPVHETASNATGKKARSVAKHVAGSLQSEAVRETELAPAIDSLEDEPTRELLRAMLAELQALRREVSELRLIEYKPTDQSAGHESGQGQQEGKHEQQESSASPATPPDASTNDDPHGFRALAKQLGSADQSRKGKQKK